jgi:hypothetical protein
MRGRGGAAGGVGDGDRDGLGGVGQADAAGECAVYLLI